MLRICFAAILFLISGTCFSQNYIEYHKKFSAIEELIVNEQFQRAEDSIIQLFSLYDPPYLREVDIAIQICALNRSYENTAVLIELAFKKGAELASMKTKPVLQDFIKTTKWLELTENYPKYRKVHFNSIDSVLRDNFRARFEKEEVSRGTDSFAGIVENNFYHIVKIINLIGCFPGEKVVGVQQLGDYMFGDFGTGYYSYDNSKVTVTLLHYQLAFSSLEKELLRAVEQGNLHPYDYAMIYDFQKNYAQKKDYYRVKKNYVNFIRPSLPDYDFNVFYGYCDNFDKVNTDRATIGLCTYQTEKQKTKIDEKYNLEIDQVY